MKVIFFEEGLYSQNHAGPIQINNGFLVVIKSSG